MDDIMLNIPLTKVIDMVLQEERMKIRKFYHSSLGQSTADYMDNYVPVESEILKIFTCPETV